MYLGRCGPASTRGAVTQMSGRDASLFMLWGELWFQNAPGLKVRFIEPAPPLISFLFILSGESLKRHGAVCLVTVEHGQVCGCQCDMTHTAEHDAPSRTVVFGPHVARSPQKVSGWFGAFLFCECCCWSRPSVFRRCLSSIYCCSGVRPQGRKERAWASN